MTLQIGKVENKFYLHNSSNGNEKYLTNYSLENRLACLNSKIKKKGGKTMDLHLQPI